MANGMELLILIWSGIWFIFDKIIDGVLLVMQFSGQYGPILWNYIAEYSCVLFDKDCFGLVL